MLSTDSIASSDLLGRHVFAQRIITGLTASFHATNESLVVGINGRWGSGKSTLLSYLSQCMDDHYQNDETKYCVLHFNSWGNATDQDLERNFLEAILKSLVRVDWKRSVKDANEKFKGYLKYLEHLKFIRHLNPVAGAAVGALEDYLSSKSVQSLEEIKAQASEALKEKGIKFYIFIDDLDRLTPSEITAIFRVLKINFNLLNTFFIIAYDKDVIIHALAQQYGVDGARYLEKIIQVEFAVPPILESQLEEMFFERLEKYMETIAVSADLSLLFPIWKYHGFKEYFGTVRDLNRYFNSLVFSLPIVANEVNIMEFLVLEAIKVFDFEAYERLLKEVRLLRRMAVWESVKFDEKYIAGYDSATTRALLKYLFITPYSNGSTLERTLRDSEFFERYFALSLSALDVGSEQVAEFFLHKRNRIGLLNSIYKNGKLKSFLRRLSDSELSQHYKVDDERIFGDFLDFWSDEEKLNNDLRPYIFKSYYNLANNFSDKRTGAQAAMRELVLHGTSEPRTLRFLFNYFIHVGTPESGGEIYLGAELKEQVAIFKPQLEKDFLTYLKDHLQHHIRKIRSEKGEWYCNVFLYAFARFLPEEYLTAWDNSGLNNTRVIAYILKNNFVMYETGTGNPGQVIYDKKEIFFPDKIFHEMIEKLRDVKSGELDQQSSAVVKLFLSANQ